MNLNPITMQLVADKYIRFALEEDIHSEDVSTNAQSTKHTHRHTSDDPPAHFPSQLHLSATSHMPQ